MPDSLAEVVRSGLLNPSSLRARQHALSALNLMIAQATQKDAEIARLRRALNGDFDA
jgi:hypothetical protein